MKPMTFTSRRSDHTRRFMTVAEAASLLGVSESTLFRAIRAGDFPAIKVRGRYVVPAKAIDDLESSALDSGLIQVPAPAFGREG